MSGPAGKVAQVSTQTVAILLAEEWSKPSRKAKAEAEVEAKAGSMLGPGTLEGRSYEALTLQPTISIPLEPRPGVALSELSVSGSYVPRIQMSSICTEASSWRGAEGRRGRAGETQRDDSGHVGMIISTMVEG